MINASPLSCVHATTEVWPAAWRRALCALLLGAGCAGLAFAAPGAQPPAARDAKAATAVSKVIEVAPRWSAGDAVGYTFEKSREKAGKPPLTLTYEVQVLVQEASPNGYALLITMPGFGLSADLLQAAGTDPKASEVMTGVQTMARALKFVVRTDADATPIELVNWQEVAQNALAGAEAIASAVGLPATARAAMAALYATEASTRETVLRDVDIFLRPLGLSQQRGVWAETDGEVSGKLMGAIKVRERVLVDLDPQNRAEAVVTQTREFDRASMAAAGNRLLNALAPGPSRDALMGQLDVRDRATYRIELKTGWVTTAESTRSVIAIDGAPAQIDRLKIRRLQR